MIGIRGNIGLVNRVETGFVTMKNDVRLLLSLHKWEKGKTYKYKKEDESVKLEYGNDYVTLHESLNVLEGMMTFKPKGEYA